MTHPCALEPEELLKLCERKNYKDSGPGGQHRNKVETGVELIHSETGIKARASERRQQAENLRMALKRLRLELALHHRQPWQQPSKLWLNRLQGTKIHVSSEHQDFATLLAEALDCWQSNKHNCSEIAALLNCTLSQLVKFLKKFPPALAKINSVRKKMGLHLLR